MSLIDFAKTVGKLKKVKRTGWVVAGIKNPESVAEHSFRLAVLCMVIGKKLNLDTEKLIKMALIHDLAESIVGDLVLERGRKTVMNSQKKFNLEERAIKNLFSKINNGKDCVKLWNEFNEQKTPEAQLFKQLDKFEMVVQALEYEGETDSKKLDEFWHNTRKHLKEPELLLLLEELSELREKTRKSAKKPT